MNFFSPEVLIGRVIGLVIGFTLHEWAHAWTAYRLGDNTAYYQGRLTLNPRAHIEPIGIILALIAGFGWAKPVPVNSRAFYPNEKRGLVIVSLAGPLMNLFIALGVGVLIRLLTAGGLFEGEARILVGSGEIIQKGVGAAGALTFVYNVLGTVVLFNLVLCLFNLIPLAPLDGYKIAVGTLPPQQAGALIRYERETTLALMLLILLGAMSSGGFSPLWSILGPPLRFLYELFAGFYPVF
ncbi:MAG: site-2 protease family protein [Anaerolineae bacterium]|nr:site-2 protease family protein [Anaerolineae bacterium]